MKIPAKYTLVRSLGEGGMGRVFLAILHGADGFQKTVAVKLMLEGPEGSDFDRMFEREAKTSALLHHPNIVQTLDYAKNDDGQPFIVMEYVHGRDLAAIAQETPLSTESAIALFAQLLDALAYAHQCPTRNGVQCIIHRDISPQNLIITRDGTLKLTDFGLARALETTRLTSPNLLKGKAPYMSPEQALGDELDARTDLFSAGIVLWEMLAGERLFARKKENHLATIRRILEDPIDPPSSANPDVSEELDAYCLKLLAKDREKRFESAAAARQALDLLPSKADRAEVVELMRMLCPDHDPRDLKAISEPNLLSPSQVLEQAIDPSVQNGESQSIRASSLQIVEQRHRKAKTQASQSAGRTRWAATALTILACLLSWAAWMMVRSSTPHPPQARAPSVALLEHAEVAPTDAPTESENTASEGTTTNTPADNKPVERPAHRAKRSRPRQIQMKAEVFHASAPKEAIESPIYARRTEMLRCFRHSIRGPRIVKVWLISNSAGQSVHPVDRDVAAERFGACLQSLDLPMPKNTGRSYDVVALTFAPPKENVL